MSVATEGWDWWMDGWEAEIVALVLLEVAVVGYGIGAFSWKEVWVCSGQRRS